jgi:hypothetical protein
MNLHVAASKKSRYSPRARSITGAEDKKPAVNI